MRKLFFAAFLLSYGSLPAQNIPIVSRNTWMVKGGSTFSLPLTGTYHDFSLIKGSDYFWEYNASPLAAFWAPYVEVNRVVNASFHSGNIGFYSFGGSYRQHMAHLKYDGWEGGGSSGVFYEGEAVRTWTDHYLQGHFKITHQFGLGKQNRTVLNTLGFSAGFRMYEFDKRTFTGAFNNGPEYYHEYVFKGVPERWYVPQLKLNYEFSLVLHAKRYMFLPVIETSLLNLNNILRFSFPDRKPLQRHREYYKELSFGVIVMRNMMR
jgi:hypothetical protein